MESTALTTPADALYAVGQVARLTGISVETLRVWERRYGAPVAVRLPSGHRRYTGEQVRHLRRVAEALARGHRAGQVVKLSEEGLEELLGTSSSPAAAPFLQRWMERVREFAEAELRRELEKGLSQEDLCGFLEYRVGPLLSAVGRAWADGDIQVRHEHVVTHVVDDVLRQIRRPMEPAADAPLVLLATLPGELHEVGLQMTAAVCADAGLRTSMLGAQTPLDDIVGTAQETGATIVAISVSLYSGGVDADRALAELRRQLPAGTELVVGGAGARRGRRGPRGVRFFERFTEFGRWLSEQVPSGD